MSGRDERTLGALYTESTNQIPHHKDNRNRDAHFSPWTFVSTIFSTGNLLHAGEVQGITSYLEIWLDILNALPIATFATLAAWTCWYIFGVHLVGKKKVKIQKNRQRMSKHLISLSRKKTNQNWAAKDEAVSGRGNDRCYWERSEEKRRKSTWRYLLLLLKRSFNSCTGIWNDFNSQPGDFD